MRSWKRLSVTFLVGVIMVAGCTAPQQITERSSSSGSQRPAAPKKIVAAISATDPLILRSNAGGVFGGSDNGIDAIENLVSAGAVLRNVEGELRPQLAEAVPSIESGSWKVLPDGRMETTWRLRPDARWHDGTPFTSADLLFTLNLSRDQEMAAFNGHIGFDMIDGAETPDARTITVKWRQPFIEADTLFTTQFALPMPKHLLEKSYTEDKLNVVQLPYWTDAFVGTGPFKLKDWAKGSYLTLQAFDQYPLGRPKIDEIVVKFISDQSTMVANMLAAEVDVNLGRGLSLEQGLQVRDQWRDGKMAVGLFNWVVLYPQFIDPNPIILLDPRMRKALMHAMDRQEMADAFQGGLTPVAHSIIDTSLPQYRALESQVVRYEYDPRRASQMIEALGYTRGSDGMFRSASGDPLTVQIQTTGGQEIQTKTMLSVADYWQRAGVTANTSVLGGQRRTDREFRATRAGFEVSRTPDDQKGLRRAHGSETPLPENNFSKSGNNARYMNPEFDTLLDRFFATIPMAERNRVLGQIVHHQTDLNTVMGIFYGAEPTLISNRLINAGARGTQETTNAWNANAWDLKP